LPALEPLYAQVVKSAPAGGVPMLPPDSLDAFTLTGAKEDAEMDIVTVTGQPFTRALRLRTKTRPATEFAVQASATPIAPVKRGDVLLATFYVRAIEGGQPETGEAHTRFAFVRTNPRFAMFTMRDVPAPRGKWRRVDIAFRANDDGTPDECRVSFLLGYAPQVIEIGVISFVNYQDRVQLRDLPHTRITYLGREANAAWRKAAEARIDQIRKADLAISVRDPRGRPARNAKVAVRMKKHAFAFGSAVAADMLLGEGPDNDKYRQMIIRLFNRVVMENDLKWPQWEGNPNRAKRGVAWLREQGIEVRGHNLVWPSWRNSPRDLRALSGDKAALAKRVHDHILNEVTAMRGQLVEWDVVNEPFANHDIMDVLGNDVMIDWYKWAHEADPGPRLFLNDYPPLDGAATNDAHLNAFEKTLRFLKDGGAPLGGIGFQCHIGGGLIPPEHLISGLDRFAKLDLPIEATEFDVNTDDEDAQADYTRDFMTALFSHPAANGIMMWGFWEGRHWIPQAALWRRDWTIKPNGQAWLDLVQKAWWTNADGKTDRSGVYHTRGFLGDYEVTVTTNGRTKTVPAKLEKGGTRLTVSVE